MILLLKDLLGDVCFKFVLLVSLSKINHKSAQKDLFKCFSSLNSSVGLWDLSIFGHQTSLGPQKRLISEKNLAKEEAETSRGVEEAEVKRILLISWVLHNRRPSQAIAFCFLIQHE